MSSQSFVTSLRVCSVLVIVGARRSYAPTPRSPESLTLNFDGVLHCIDAQCRQTTNLHPNQRHIPGYEPQNFAPGTAAPTPRLGDDHLDLEGDKGVLALVQPDTEVVWLMA
jgi:hypothetical protein